MQQMAMNVWQDGSERLRRKAAETVMERESTKVVELRQAF